MVGLDPTIERVGGCQLGPHAIDDAFKAYQLNLALQNQ